MTLLRISSHLKMPPVTIWFFCLAAFTILATQVTNAAEEDCPWYGNPRVPLAIKANCLCARNRTSQQNQLSIQCHEVEGNQLVSLLISARQGSKDPLELLYLNGSHVTDSTGQVPSNLFKDLKLVSLQLSGCSIKSIHPDAFRGQEAHMKHLSLAQNQLTEVPVTSLERLTGLVLLDMSYNKITKVPHNAFHTLNKLSTLKLNDNNLEFDSQSFNGLEKSLRNLNLKEVTFKIFVDNAPDIRSRSHGAPAGRYINSDSVGTTRKLPSSSYTTIADFDESKVPVITGVGPIRAVSGMPTSINYNAGSATPVRTSLPPPPHHTSSSHSHHSIVLPPQTSPSLNSNRPPNLIFADKPDIVLKNVERNGDSVYLQWESLKQISGFRIIYRIFGEDSFRHGPALASTEKDFRVKNIPTNECVVVCVVPYEDILYNEISPSPGSIPPGSQCREIKPSSPSALMNHMDKITIGASAAICATVMVAVVLFIIVTRRSKGKRSGSGSGLITKIPPGSMASPSPGPQNIISQGSLGYSKEWDQQSAISVRSIPRARVYHGNTSMESNMMSGHDRNTRSNGMHSQRQMADGHSSHRSYLSAHHAHHNHSMHAAYNNNHGGGSHGASGGANSYLNNQSRLLRASVGSRSSRDHLDKQFAPPPQHRQYEQNQKRRRPPGRLSHSDSLNTLSGYETPDNWTDHDMDVYVARNPTRHDFKCKT